MCGYFSWEGTEEREMEIINLSYDLICYTEHLSLKELIEEWIKGVRKAKHVRGKKEWLLTRRVIASQLCLWVPSQGLWNKKYGSVDGHHFFPVTPASSAIVGKIGVCYSSVFSFCLKLPCIQYAGHIFTVGTMCWIGIL